MSKINEFLTEFADLLEKHDVCIEAKYEIGFMGESDISQWFVIHNPAHPTHTKEDISIDIDTDPLVDTVMNHKVVRQYIIHPKAKT